MINSMIQQVNHYFSSQLFFNNNFILSANIILLIIPILFLIFLILLKIQLKRESTDSIDAKTNVKINIVINILIILVCVGIIIFVSGFYSHTLDYSPWFLAIILLLAGIIYIGFVMKLIQAVKEDKDTFQSNMKTNIIFITCIILIAAMAVYSMGSAIVCLHSGFCKLQSFQSIDNYTNLTYQVDYDNVDFFCQSGNHYYYVGTINQNHSQIIAKNDNIESPESINDELSQTFCKRTENTNRYETFNISPQFKELTQTINKPQVRSYFKVNDGSRNILSVKNGQLILTNISQTQGKNARLVLNDTKQKTQSGFKKHLIKQKITKNSTLYVVQ